MTREKVPYVDDWTGEKIDDDETRYTAQFTKATTERGTIIKSQNLDMSHSSFKKLVLDKVEPSKIKWSTIQRNPISGKWETIKP